MEQKDGKSTQKVIEEVARFLGEWEDSQLLYKEAAEKLVNYFSGDESALQLTQEPLE
jgi:hypothetical protein